MNFALKVGTSAIVTLILIKIGQAAIASMGELVHFNCRSITAQSRCELTHEPLIGSLETRYLNKADLVETRVQTDQGRSRLVLVLRSQQQLPLTRNWSRTANAQLLAQRSVIDRFLATPQMDTLSVRTHRPWQLWAILAVLGLIGGGIGLLLWSPLIEGQSLK